MSIRKLTHKDHYEFGDITKSVLLRTFRRGRFAGGLAGGSEIANNRSENERSQGKEEDELNEEKDEVERNQQKGDAGPVVYEKVPGPKPRLIVGNVPDILPSIVPACRLLAQKYGPIVRLTLLGKPFFVVSSPTLLEPLLSLSDKFLPRQEIAPDGIFLADGEMWAVARSTLQVCFTDRYMPLFIPVFINHGQKLMALAHACSDAGTIDIFDTAERLMFDVICEAGFNMPSDTLGTGKHSEFSLSFERAFGIQKKRAVRLDFVNKLPTSTNRRFSASLRAVNSAVDDVIEESSRRSETEEASASDVAGANVADEKSKCPISRDLLSLMLKARHPETGEQLTHANLRHQLITLLVAGHKTSSLLFSWSLYQITQHPEVEAEILHEQIEIFGADDTRPPTADEIKRMKYLEKVCKETLRLYPPAQSVIRGTTDSSKGIVLGGRYRIKPGSRCLVNVVGVHRDPLYWETPDDFIPERFNSERMAKMHPYQYIPFGGGPRMCIGNLFAVTQVKAILSMILRQYSVRMAPDKPVVTKEGGNPLEPLSGIHTVWTRRTDYAQLASIKPDLGTLLALDDDESPAAVRTANLTHSLARSIIAPVVTDKALPIPQKKRTTAKVDIVFGSNQGTCEEFAQRLARDGESVGISSRVMSLDKFLPELEHDLAASVHTPDSSPNRSIVIVCSSYNGLPPDNARKLCAWLKRTISFNGAGDLSNIEYCVFGCGNAQWAATFQKVPREIDVNLSALGADRILAFGAGDEDAPGGLEVGLSAFSTLLWPMLGSSGIPLSMTQAVFDAAMTSSVAGVDPTTQLPRKYLVRMGGTVPEAKLSLPLHRVCANTELLTNVTDRSTRHIEIELTDDETYEAGDHFEIMPQNKIANVRALASRLGLAVDCVFTLLLAEGQPSASLPPFAQNGPCTLGDALSVSDILAPPSQQSLLRLAMCAQSEQERHNLGNMAQPFENNLRKYIEYVVAPRRSLLEILNDHPSVVMSIAELLEIVPPLRPRYYSISSSPRLRANVLSLTVGVAVDTTQTGRVHNGIASSFLSACPEGTLVPGRIRSSHFRLPSVTNTAPLIFCCNGTGLAPFRGFLQELKSRDGDARPSSCLLFFGCRSASEDYLYGAELKQLEQEGVVCVVPAFSRDQEQKVYIQHLLDARKHDIWRMIHDESGTIMLCGDARTMAQDVRNTLEQIAIQQGSLSNDDAQIYWDSLMAQDRLILDVWG